MESSMRTVAKQVGQQGNRGGVKLRQGVCTAVQNMSGGLCTVTATVDGESLTGVACVSGIYPAVDQGVWLLNTRGGKWICIGGVGSDKLPSINSRRIILSGSDDEKLRIHHGSTSQGYISFYTNDGATPYGYLTSLVSGEMVLRNDGGGLLRIDNSLGGYVDVVSNVQVGGTGPMITKSTSTEKIRLQGGTADSAYISFYNPAGTTRAGVIQGIAGDMRLFADAGVLWLHGSRYVITGDKTAGNQIDTRGIEIDDGIGRLWVTKDHTSTAATIVAHQANATGAPSGTAFLQCNRAGSNIGQVEVATSSSVNYKTTSDARLKDVLGPLEDATDRVKALNPVKFIWTRGGEIDEGFVAQEAVAAVPNAVSVGGDDVDTDPWGIDYAKVVPLLTAALQNALSRIETLEAKVVYLESKENQ